MEDRASTRGSAVEENRHQRLGEDTVCILVYVNVVGKKLLRFIVEHLGEIVDAAVRRRRDRISIHVPRERRQAGKIKLVRLCKPAFAARMVLPRQERRLERENAIQFGAATVCLRRENTLPQRTVRIFFRKTGFFRRTGSQLLRQML